MPMKKIIVFLVIFGIFGCVAAEINYPARAVVIKVDNSYKSQIARGKIEILKSFKTYNIIKVTFNKVRGGKTLLFGKEINDAGNGYKVKRLDLLKNDKIINRYSLNEVLKLKKEMIDTFKVYVIPD